MLLVQKQMSERVTALARHDFPEKPHQNAHLDCQVMTAVYQLFLCSLYSLCVSDSYNVILQSAPNHSFSLRMNNYEAVFFKSV